MKQSKSKIERKAVLYYFLNNFKNKLSLLMLLFGTITLNAQTTSTPWYEGFYTSNLPVGWQENNFFVTNQINNINSPTTEGSYIYANLINSFFWVVDSAEFTTLEIGPILTGDQLFFKHKIVDNFNPTVGPGNDTGDFKVQISTDDGLTFATVSTIVNGNLAEWNSFQFDLASYVGQNIKVKILAQLNTSLNSDYYIAFDQFLISSNSCTLPDAPFQITSSLNSVEFDFGGDPLSNYQVEYGDVGFQIGLGTLSSISVGNVLTVSGLLPSSVYSFYVKKVCSSSSSSPWAGPFQMSTSCGVLNSSFSQNFESTTAGIPEVPTVPICWNFIGPPYIDFDSGYGFVSQFGAANGQNCFVIFNSLDDTSNFILVGPQTDNLGNGDYQLRFLAKVGFDTEELIVGTMSDPNNENSFTLLPGATVELTDQYQEFIIPLPAGSNDYFAFKHGATGFYNEIFIDDVYFEEPPLCPGVNFGSGTVTGITNTQATLSWTSTSVLFDIEYGLEGFTLGSGTTVSGISNDYLLTNLLDSTDYSFYVRSNCGVDLGEWRGPFDFKTQTLVTSPWFEALANEMPTGFEQNDFYLSNNVQFLLPADGYFYVGNIFSANTSGIGVTTLNVGPILTGDKFSFNYNFARFSQISPIDENPGEINILISTDFGQSYSTLATVTPSSYEEWLFYEAPLTQYVGQNVRIKLEGIWDELSEEDFYLGFDNLYIGSCELPQGVQIVGTTLDSVTISTVGFASDSYQIEYGISGFTQGTGTISPIIQGTQIQINGLDQATNYDFYIRKICSATSNSAWVGKYSFATSCEIFGAFSEDFESVNAGDFFDYTIPICWVLLDESDGYGTVTAFEASSGTNSFLLNNDIDTNSSLILVSPETLNLGNGLFSVRFKAKGDSNGEKLEFGTMSNKLDASTFSLLQTINLTSSFQEYTVYLPVGTNDYFAFKHGLVEVYRNIYIDDVVYEPIPSCPNPINLNAVKNLVNLTANLSWEGPPFMTNNNFEVQWGVTGFTLGSGTIVPTTDYNVSISNLILDESYSFYVRRICGNDNSQWIGPFNFEMNYCESAPSTIDELGVTNVTFGSSSFDIVYDPLQSSYYVDLTNEDVNLDGSQIINSSISYDLGSFVNYQSHIWIDLNNDGVFDNEDELFFTGNSVSGGPYVLNSSFSIPNIENYITGDYRIRIVSTDSEQSPPDPCYSSFWGVTVDLLANITFPCPVPSNVSFEVVGYNEVTISWDGPTVSEYEIEYGLTGFQQGQGVIVQSATSPIEIAGLISGQTYDFYVRTKCGSTFSDWSIVATQVLFCDTVAPTGDSSQTLIQDQLLSDLVILGQNLRFYTNSSLTNEVPANTAVQTSGIYYVTQTIGCESEDYLLINLVVTPRIAIPIVNPNQSFCDNAVLGDIPVTSLPGATVIWYNSATSVNPLPISTALQTGTYYVVQTDGVTTSLKVTVNVSVLSTPTQLNSQTLQLCGNYLFGNLNVGNLPGTIVRWYASLTSTTPIGNNVVVTSGTYYVTQGNGNCESNRVIFVISQSEALNRPDAILQNFCGSGTVGDLVATGVPNAQILWYSSANALNPLSLNTPLVSGTYYVEQNLNGCVSERRAVAVRVVSLTAPQVSPFVICGGGTIANLFIPAVTGVTHNWYISPTSTNVLDQSTPLTTGVYFVSRVQAGCESNRVGVQVTIGDIPISPTGNAIQSFMEGATVVDLVLNQTNLTWYISYNDSQTGTNPLAPQTPLVNGTTYYAVIIGTNGCPSLPFPVTVEVVLSNNEFVKDQLKYYPNPIVDVLSVSYSEKIIQIEVFDLLGKRVKVLSTSQDNVQINLSDLASGTYMIQLKTDSKTQFIKVIKK